MRLAYTLICDCYFSRIINMYTLRQGRRHVLKSGPAEDMFECRRHEWGASTRGGFPPSRKGGSGDLPRENFDKLVLLNAI